MSLYNLEFSDSGDSSLGIHIASRLPVNSKTIELLTFTPPIGDSSEGMLVIAYWFFNPHSPRHQVFYPLDMPVICYLRLHDRSSSAKADSLADACRDLDPCVDLPALLVAVFVGALADSGSFPSLRLFAPSLGQRRVLHPYQHHHLVVSSE
nr:hypothetical protein [Tanacetum cinerariifolium]